MARGRPPTRICDLPLHEAVEAVMDRLGRVRRRTLRGTLHRAMYAKHLLAPVVAPEPLHFNGSLSGRRFTPRRGPAGLYLSFDPSTPPAELRAVVFEHGCPVSTEEHDPIMLIAVRPWFTGFWILPMRRRAAPSA